MEQFITSLSIFLWSTVKYALGAGIALYSNIGLIPSILLTTGGGMLGIWVFTQFGAIIKTYMQKMFPSKMDPNRTRINRKMRLLVSFKNQFGLFGIALLTPIMLSIPLGVIMSLSLSNDKKRIFKNMFASFVIWSLIFFLPYYLLGLDIQSALRGVFRP